MLQQHTLTFLTALREHNDRLWFKEHRKDYEKAKANFAWELESFTRIAEKIDDNIKDAESEKHTFRINRDIRFSKNKKPYKSHMSGYICPGWKANKEFRACYYLHIEPFNSFMGGGNYAPSREYLEKIREKIARDGHELEAILNNKTFKKYFWGLRNVNKLKTAPKGYSKDHQYIDLLNHKWFTVRSELSDVDLQSKEGHIEYKKRIKALKPLNDWLNNIHV